MAAVFSDSLTRASRENAYVLCAGLFGAVDSIFCWVWFDLPPFGPFALVVKCDKEVSGGGGTALLDGLVLFKTTDKSSSSSSEPSVSVSEPLTTSTPFSITLLLWDDRSEVKDDPAEKLWLLAGRVVEGIIGLEGDT